MVLTEAPTVPGQRPISVAPYQTEIQHGPATNRSRAFDTPAATRRAVVGRVPVPSIRYAPTIHPLQQLL